MNEIKEFRGKYFFLSNFFETPVTWQGITYQNNEAAFHSAKVINQKNRQSFASLNPSKAKSKGRHVQLRNDWEKIKDNIMYEICYCKFSQNEELKKKLIATGNALLVEGNTWGDKYWGVCNGTGKNKLGKILMRVREELKSAE